MNATNLGLILRERRTERGLSLREFSEYLSISHAYLSKLEKGVDPRTGREVTPTIEVLSKIANGLELPLGSFLNECGYIGNTGFGRGPLTGEALDLDTLAAEFVNAVADAPALTRGGKPVTGGRSQKTDAAVDALLAYIGRQG